jgi:hypothetical protein
VSLIVGMIQGGKSVAGNYDGGHLKEPYSNGGTIHQLSIRYL